MSRFDKRNGFTLIELLAVISIGSFLMLLTIAWIGETLGFASRTTSNQRQHQQLTRLGWNFRSDVHLSQSMTMENDKRLVLQRADGHRISYSISGTTIEMENFGGSQVSRESYRLAAGSRIDWDTSGMPDSIGLIVSRTPPGMTPSNAESKVAGANNQNANQPDEPEATPIDIHLYAHANRWHVAKPAEQQDGGTE